MSDSEGSDSGSVGGWEADDSDVVGSPSSSRGRSSSDSLGSPSGFLSDSPWGSPGQGSSEHEGTGSRRSEPHQTPNLRVEGQKSNTPSDGVTSDAVDLPKCPRWFEGIWTAMNDGFIDLQDDMFKEGTYTYHADMTAWLNKKRVIIERWWNPEVNNDEILILLTNLLVLYHEQGVLDPQLDKTVPASEEAKKQKDYLAEKKVHLETLQADILAAMQDAGGGTVRGVGGASKGFVELRF